MLGWSPTRPVVPRRFRGGRWQRAGPPSGAAEAPGDTLTVTTFNLWFADVHARTRYRATADVLARHRPDVMVFQEVTPPAVTELLAAPWVRAEYDAAVAAGPADGSYGMLLLSRLPLHRVWRVRRPGRRERGHLRAEIRPGGRPLTVCGVHLMSGKVNAALRATQLRRLDRALRGAPDAVVAGDFNMRDAEGAIGPPFRDVWPMLRPDEPGWTEDTDINHMRWDAKPSARQVRFDRVLLKGAAWAPEHIELLGTEPVSADLPRIFPSDHFGVLCRLRAAAASQRCSEAGRGHR